MFSRSPCRASIPWMRSPTEIGVEHRRSMSSMYAMLSSRACGPVDGVGPTVGSDDDLGVQTRNSAERLDPEHRSPVLLDGGGGELGTDQLHHRLGRDKSRARETCEQHGRTQVMVSVLMGDVDRGDPLALRLHPVGEGVRVVDWVEGVDQHCVALCRDQRRRGRRPGPPARGRWQLRRPVDRSGRCGIQSVDRVPSRRRWRSLVSAGRSSPSGSSGTASTASTRSLPSRVRPATSSPSACGSSSSSRSSSGVCTPTTLLATNTTSLTRALTSFRC